MLPPMGLGPHHCCESIRETNSNLTSHSLMSPSVRYTETRRNALLYMEAHSFKKFSSNLHKPFSVTVTVFLPPRTLFTLSAQFNSSLNDKLVFSERRGSQQVWYWSMPANCKWKGQSNEASASAHVHTTKTQRKQECWTADRWVSELSWQTPTSRWTRLERRWSVVCISGGKRWRENFDLNDG